MVDQTELKRDEHERRITGGRSTLVAELAKVGAKVVAGNGGEISTPQRQPMLASLETLKLRSNDNWGALIAAIHRFVDDQRNELDRLERWLGTK